MQLYMPLFRSSSTQKTLLQIHAHLLIAGLQRDAFATSKLIESYAKMGSIETARLVFDSFSKPPDSFMWGVLIKGCVWNLCFTEAISLYQDTQYHRIQPSDNIFPSVLRACAGLYDAATGKKIHGNIIKSGFECNSVVQTSLVFMYGETSSSNAARRVFDGMIERDVVAWSSMVSSYILSCQTEKGLAIFAQMISENIKPDSVMLRSVTKACGDLGLLRQAKSVHGHMVRRSMEIDGSLENSVVAMYGKCGDLESAENVIKNASQTSVLSWTAMISCYNQRSCFQDALNTCIQMQKSGVEPNSVTMGAVLFSCTQLGCLREGKSAHGFVVRRSMDMESNSLGTALINMYASCRKLGDCGRVFESIKKTVLSSNSLIAAYAQNELPEEALAFFVRMQREGLFPDSFTLSSSLSVCAQIGHLHVGSQIHCHIVKKGFQFHEFVHNSLIDMYCKSGLPDTAYRIFAMVSKKDIITWNVMINGFAQQGNSVEAINLFDQMHSKGLHTDKVTFLGTIQACSHMGGLGKGRWVHHKLIISGLEKDTYLDTALTNMYAKCGDLQMARRVFDCMSGRNVVSWSTIIAAYGIHGLGNDAITLFSQMLESGIRPNEVTFTSILSACSHAGFLEEGQFYFDMMRHKFGIAPESDHFTCMVDLLSRAGHIDRALDFIKSVPVEETNTSIWGALLNGCHIHRRIDMVASIQRKLMETEVQQNSGYYVLVSNIYAEGGIWDKFGMVRSMMKHMHLRKAPGYSTIEIDKRVYVFNVGYTSHSLAKEIYTLLEDLEILAQKQGYIPDGAGNILGTNKSTKEENVRRHSEKLAVAFGIVNTSPGIVLRISKNLRVCHDCHAFMKFVSKITSRQIIMRDLNRFHHLKNGSCSCGDYW